jgi:hypothetical protein
MEKRPITTRCANQGSKILTQCSNEGPWQLGAGGPATECPATGGLRSHLLGLGLLAVLCVSSGATCAWNRKMPTLRSEFAPPLVFQSTPNLDQLIAFANRSQAIDRIESNTIKVTSPDMGGQKLNGDIQWERPLNFSMHAYFGSRAFGTALAAGSNSQRFWLQQSSPPTLYYADYAAFESQPGPRHILPVSPIWLREAMGIVEFDSSWQHSGPHVRVDGRLEVQSLIPSPRGPYQRVVAFAPGTGAIEETTLKDPSGKLIARALQSQHEYYSAIDFSLPHKIIVELEPDGSSLAFTVEVGFYTLNQPSSARSSPFEFPDTTGLSQVDLVRANAQLGQPAPVPPVYRANQASTSLPQLGTRVGVMR